jgi:hypothetical protein
MAHVGHGASAAVLALPRLARRSLQHAATTPTPSSLGAKIRASRCSAPPAQALNVLHSVVLLQCVAGVAQSHGSSSQAASCSQNGPTSAPAPPRPHGLLPQRNSDSRIRSAPGCRPRERPVRAAKGLLRRSCAVHGRIAGVRPRLQRLPPDRLSRRAGHRRGAVQPSAAGIVADHFGKNRDRAIGLFGAVAARGQVIAPVFEAYLSATCLGGGSSLSMGRSGFC